MHQKALKPLLVALAAFVVFATRWWLAPQYLYYFDSINFALSLDDFDPWKHQPQPPGYPLYVALMRLIHLVVSDPQEVTILAGIVLTLASLALVARLGREMHSWPAGLLAVAVLTFNPAFWFGGLTNQVRIGLAFCSAAVALLAWRALRRPDRPRRFWIACGVLGLGAGFRPVDAVLLLPLIFVVWWQSGRDLRRLAAGLAAMAVGALVWLVPTVVAVGGISRWFLLIWSYGRDQFHGTSLLFGASGAAAGEMALRAVVWTWLGVLTWIWALAFARPALAYPQVRQRFGFLAVWLVPIILFLTIVHIGDPDQSLAAVTALAVMGGLVLAELPSRSLWMAGGAVAALNVLLFFQPPGRIAEFASYGYVAKTDDRIQMAFEDILIARGDVTGPVTLIHYGSEVTWRHLFYYLPGDHLVYLPTDPGELVMTFRNRTYQGGALDWNRLPDPKRVILLAPHLNPAWLTGRGWKKRGVVWVLDRVNALADIEIGKHHLVPGRKVP